MISVRQLTDAGALEELVGPWDNIVAGSPRATPFSSAAWNLPCWRHLGRGSLLALAFEENGQLLGLAPLFREPGLGRRLRWIGMLSPNSWRDYPVSDYADLVCLPGAEQDVSRAFWNYLSNHRSSWSALDLRLLPKDGVLAQYGEPRVVTRAEVGSSVVLPLPKTWSEYVRSVTPNMRPALERIPRKLQRERAAQFERVQNTAQLEVALQHLFRLHNQRWQADGQPGLYALESIRALTREAASRFLALGWLEMWTLSIDGQVVSTQFNVRLRDTVYYCTSGYLTGEFDAYSPGRTLMAHTLRTAVEEGAVAYDFLRGEHSYKARFGALPVPQLMLQAYSGGLARCGLGTWDAGVRLARVAYRQARRSGRQHNSAVHAGRQAQPCR